MCWGLQVVCLAGLSPAACEVTMTQEIFSLLHSLTDYSWSALLPTSTTTFYFYSFNEMYSLLYFLSFTQRERESHLF